MGPPCSCSAARPEKRGLSPIVAAEGTDGNTVKQQGFFFESATSEDFNPSIAVNAAGEAIVVWNSTDVWNSTPSLRHNARIRFSGRRATDGLGVIPAGESLVTSSSALIGNPVPSGGATQRWGDYSAVSLDSKGTATCAINRRAAVFNEKVIDSGTWGSQYALVGFCNGVVSQLLFSDDFETGDVSRWSSSVGSSG